MINDHCPYFLNERPFLFHKWSQDFGPAKEIVKEILLWIKFSKFLFCCWNEVGISKALIVDSLTVAKTHITFVRVCVQITHETILPNSIPINLNSLKFEQAIVYDWKLVLNAIVGVFLL